MESSRYYSKVTYWFTKLSRTEIGDRGIGEPVVTPSIKNFNEYPPTTTSPREYAAIATLIVESTQRIWEVSGAKTTTFFMGSYPVKSGPIQLVNEWEGILFFWKAGKRGRRASGTEIGRMKNGSSPGRSPYITLSDARKRYLGVFKGRDFMSWSIWKAMGRFIFKVLEMLWIKYFEQAHLMRLCRI